MRNHLYRVALVLARRKGNVRLANKRALEAPIPFTREQVARLALQGVNVPADFGGAA